MSDQREGGIAWTDQTWNPIRGCSRISEGCRNCYAEGVAARFSGPGQPYEGMARRTNSGPHWTGKVEMVPQHFDDPIRWKRPRRIFVNSMSDLFHESLTNEQIAAVFGVMAAARRHTFQVLTKRAVRMREWFEWVATADTETGPWTHCHWEALRYEAANHPKGDGGPVHCKSEGKADDARPWPLPNVHLGISAEDQPNLDARWAELRRCPAAVRWVSAEPLLGPIDLRDYLGTVPRPASLDPRAASYPARIASPHRLDWVVVGGESGNRARSFDVDWARQLVRECKEAGIPAFVKQLGGAPFDSTGVWESRDVIPLHGPPIEEWGEDFRVREFPR